MSSRDSLNFQGKPMGILTIRARECMCVNQLISGSPCKIRSIYDYGVNDDDAILEQSSVKRNIRTWEQIYITKG